MDIYMLEIFGVVALFIMLIYPIAIFMPWYTWWNQNDPKGIYNCFSITSMAYYKFNNPVYRIWDFAFTTNPSRFKHDWWMIFISGIITGEAKGIVPGGICTPKTLCESLVPDTPPSTILPLPIGTQWPTSSSDWKTVLMSWLGITAIPTDPSNYNPNLTTWENSSTSNGGDNFLVPWGITPQSKSLIGFITNGQTNWGGDKLYATTLAPLLGIKSGSDSAGGWFGFLQEGDNFGGNGLDEANSQVWGNEQSQSRKSQDPKAACGAAGIVSSGISMGIAGAFAGTAIPIPIVGNIIGFLIGALVGSVLGAWQGKCF
jgi:hypothetical protein